MSEQVRMMARLMLALFAVCAALTAGICAVGRLLPPKQVLALAVRNDQDGTTDIYLMDTHQSKQGAYLKLPLRAFTFAESLDGLCAVIADGSNKDGTARLFIIERNGIMKQITEKINRIRQPVWPEDGRLVFEADDEWFFGLNVLGQNGKKSTICDNGTSSVWSSDGRLAFLADAVDGIGVYVLKQNEKPHLVTSLSLAARVLGPNLFWSSDGQLAFRSDYQQVNILRADGELRSVAVKDGSLAIAGWSPDGKLTTIFYDSGTENIVTIDQEGHMKNRYSSKASLNNLTWSTDGRLAFIASHDNGYELEILETDGTPYTLSQYPPKYSTSYPYFSWAPDGRLAYVSSLDNEQTEIAVLKQSGQSHVIWHGEPFLFNHFSWSQDGRLAFASPLPNFWGYTLYVYEDDSTHSFLVSGIVVDYQWIDWPFD